MIEVQSLSVCVPGGCPNACKFCVARMHTSPYVDQIEKNIRFRDLYERDYMRRLQFARDNGCNTVILTGEGEPLINRDFLKDFAHWNSMISSPFRWIEIQTSGVTLDEEALRFLRSTVGVSTIALSLSDMFDSAANQAMNGTPDKLRVDIDQLCRDIKRYDFNLRLSLNMTDSYETGFCKDLRHDSLMVGRDQIFRELIARAKLLGADQLTFRQLYASEDPSIPQNKWIAEHSASKILMQHIQNTIPLIRASRWFWTGRVLEVLPFGATRYSINDSMNTEAKPVMKYLVLRPNCRIYTRWDDPGSLLF